MSAHGIIVNDNIVWLEVSKVFFVAFLITTRTFAFLKEFSKPKL